MSDDPKDRRRARKRARIEEEIADLTEELKELDIELYDLLINPSEGENDHE